MTKIKITTPGGPTPQKRDLLQQILFDSDIRLLRLINAHDGYYTILQNNEQAERLFTDTVKDRLSSHGFTPLLPLEMRARLTLVLKRLDKQVVSEDADTIKKEISAAVPSCKVEDIYIMKEKYILKVRFSNHQTANDIKEKGIYLFRLFIAPWQIEYERFTHIKQCMNCYGYGHTKNECRTEKQTICSECGSKTHNYRNCNSAHKRCINCGGGTPNTGKQLPLSKRRG